MLISPKILIIAVYSYSADKIFHSVDEVWHNIADIPIFVHGGDRGDRYKSWDSLMTAALPVPVCRSVRQNIKTNIPSCYIFTSGTTGKFALGIIYLFVY
jgi:acyl-coenzyme A synthetase/AMP-(fatty) acid ligase